MDGQSKAGMGKEGSELAKKGGNGYEGWEGAKKGKSTFSESGIENDSSNKSDSRYDVSQAVTREYIRDLTVTQFVYHPLYCDALLEFFQPT